MATKEDDEEGEDEAKKPTIKLSPEQKAVADHVLGGKESLTFLTGKAGTGKSTLVRAIEERAKLRNINMVIGAPTGVAAINAGGQTLNSLFMFDPTKDIPLGQLDMSDHFAKMPVRKKAVLRAMNFLVIDEISMVNADTMDAIDRLLRVSKNNLSTPFGGVNILMVGDPYQLSPIDFDPATDRGTYMQENYRSIKFFDADVWAATPFEKITLTQIFRQANIKDQELLNKAQNGTITQEEIDKINAKARKNAESEKVDEGVVMVPTNGQAQEINDREMAALKSAPVKFTAESDGPDVSKLLNAGVPEPESVFKLGQKVMFLKNDDSNQRTAATSVAESMNASDELENIAPNKNLQRWVNGTQGIVVGFIEKFDQETGEQIGYSAVLVEAPDIRTGEMVTHVVTPATWEYNEYSSSVSLDNETVLREKVTLNKDTTSVYKQVPLRSAWAITIHKSQGQTYENAQVSYKAIDENNKAKRGRAFAAGQTYVALSRLKSLDNLLLTSDLIKSDFIVDPDVIRFMGEKPEAVIGKPESMVTRDFDPLKGFESSAEIENALMKSEIKGPNGETLTVYQRNALLSYLEKIKKNPESADRLRGRMLDLLNSWFSAGQATENMSAKKPVDVDVNSFTDPAEKQALLDLLSANGIPYNLKYDS
jgi:hypothetical protein